MCLAFLAPGMDGHAVVGTGERALGSEVWVQNVLYHFFVVWSWINHLTILDAVSSFDK